MTQYKCQEVNWIQSFFIYGKDSDELHLPIGLTYSNISWILVSTIIFQVNFSHFKVMVFCKPHIIILATDVRLCGGGGDYFSNVVSTLVTKKPW